MTENITPQQCFKWEWPIIKLFWPSINLVISLWLLNLWTNSQKTVESSLCLWFLKDTSQQGLHSRQLLMQQIQPHNPRPLQLPWDFSPITSRIFLRDLRTPPGDSPGLLDDARHRCLLQVLLTRHWQLLRSYFDSLHEDRMRNSSPIPPFERCLLLFYTIWKEVTSNKRVFSTVREGYVTNSPPFYSPSHLLHPFSLTHLTRSYYSKKYSPFCCWEQ